MKPNAPSRSATAQQPILTHSAGDCQQVAEAIRSIETAARSITLGPLTLGAAALLIRDLLPHGSKGRLSPRDITEVLIAAGELTKHLRKGSRP